MHSVACAGHAVSDAKLQAAVVEGLNSASQLSRERNLKGLTLVETAGGSASPAPSGTLQVVLHASCKILKLHNAGVCNMFANHLVDSSMQCYILATSQHSVLLPCTKGLC